MIIYKATNLINGKFYIGQTRGTLDSRANNHLRCALSEKRRGISTVRFHNALLKYGFENFSWEIIDRAETEEELNEKEIYWIKELNSQNKDIGYNETSGGKSGFKSKEVKAKISVKKKEDWQNPELANKMRNGLEKATKTWQKICEERRIEKKCEKCGKIFKVTPSQEQRRFCSNKCANSMIIEELTKQAAIKNHEKCLQRYKAIKAEALEWALKNKELILNCPKNKISTTLVDLQVIAENYQIKDWRIIAIAICNSPSKKDLINFLQEYVKSYAELV